MLATFIMLDFITFGDALATDNSHYLNVKKYKIKKGKEGITAGKRKMLCA